MGYPTPENRERWRDIQPGPAPVGPAGASSAEQTTTDEEGRTMPDPKQGQKPTLQPERSPLPLPAPPPAAPKEA